MEPQLKKNSSSEQSFYLDHLWGLKGFEGQGLKARLCCRRYLTPYFGYIILPHVDWPAQRFAQRKFQKNYTKRKDRNR